jgi:hypothetical protein
MGYIDPLGRFIRDPDVNSIDSLYTSNRKTYSKPFQFITQLVRNEQDEIVNFILFFRFYLFLIIS